MAVKPIPDGYHTVTPYLVVPDAAGLIDFLGRAFGAETVCQMTGPDGAVKHAEVRIGDSMVMLGQASAQHKAMETMLYLYVPDTDALYRRAMQAGAVSIMEPTDQYYGDRNAGVKDPAGNQWWMGTHVEDVPPEEIQRRAAAAGKG